MLRWRLSDLLRRWHLLHPSGLLDPADPSLLSGRLLLPLHLHLLLRWHQLCLSSLLGLADPSLPWALSGPSRHLDHLRQ